MEMSSRSLPTVAVLMSAYNGEKYLEEQIRSILAQKEVFVRLIVRDDGSSDRTPAILARCQQKGLLEWRRGKNVGYTESFMRLCAQAPPADYYAFADQDDVWLPDKLQSMTAQLQPCAQTPALCVSEWQMTDEQLRPLRRAEKALAFPVPAMRDAPQAMVQKAACAMNHVTASGCVQVWNAALQNILQTHEPPHAPIGHDVIVGMTAVLCGKFIPLAQPTILYRQHGANTSGGHSGRAERHARWHAHLARLKNKAGPNISECNAMLLRAYGDAMPAEARAILQKTIGYQQNAGKKWALLVSDYPRLLFWRDRVKFRLKVLLNRL